LEDGEWWLKVISQLGFPSVVLIGLSIALYKLGIWMAAKVVNPLVDSHTSLVAQLQSSDQRNSETLDTLAKTTSTIADTQHEIIALVKTQQRNHP
jgi:hypothetical protein